MAQVITITPDGTQSEPQELSREILEGYGTEFSTIIVENDQSEKVPMENGTRYTYGQTLITGKWICVQGLWVYFYPEIRSAEIGTGTETNYLGVQFNQVMNTRFYNQFTLKNFTYRGQTSKIDEDTFSTVLLRAGWSPNTRESIILSSKEDSTMRTTVGNYDLNNVNIHKGVLLVGVDASWVQSTRYPYGYIEIVPLMYCSGTNAYCSRSQMDQVNGGYVEKTNPGYPITFGLNSNNSWTSSWIVPMENEAEFLYNQGVTDKFTTMSYEELEDLVDSGDNND